MYRGYIVAAARDTYLFRHHPQKRKKESTLYMTRPIHMYRGYNVAAARDTYVFRRHQKGKKKGEKEDIVHVTTNSYAQGL